MASGLLTPIIWCTMASMGFAANEWTHGGVSQAMGWGHHHMMDDAPGHCQGHYGGMQATHLNMTQMMARCRSMMSNASMMSAGRMGGG